MGKAKDDKEICIQVAKVECAGYEERGWIVADKDYMWWSVLNEDLREVSFLSFESVVLCARPPW